MIHWLKGQLKTIVSTLAHNLIATIVVGAIGIPLLISWATGTLDFLLQLLQTPVPLWVIIALVPLVTVYIHLKISKIHSLQSPAEKPVIKFFTYCDMKWKVIVYENRFEVDKIPFCIEHDQQFTNKFKGYRCPGTESHACDSMIPIDLHDEFYSSVKSMVESKIRNSKKIC